ncbi:MAG: SulP family inorganic anion transporter, partial [Waddliaceae bacterium]
LNASVSVALLTLPQAIAAAIIAGLPLSCGFFAAIFSSMMMSLFGSTRHLVSNPSNSMAILLAYGTQEILHTYYPYAVDMERQVLALQILTQLTLMASLIHLLIATFQLGRLTQFISHSVIIGYLMGVAAAIAATQLYPFLGISPLKGIHSVFDRFHYIATHLGEVNITTAILGVFCLLFVVFMKKIDKRLPAGALMLALATLIGLTLCTVFSRFGLSLDCVKEMGRFDDLPLSFRIPTIQFKLFTQLLPLAASIALIGLLETSSVARTLAANTGQTVSVDQEIFALGLGNLTSAFLGALPISASPSRTAANVEAGAQSRIAGLLSCAVLWLVVMLFDEWVAHIPLTALAALLLTISLSTVKKSQIQLCQRATGADAIVLWVTFLSCLFFSINVAFYLGVFLSIASYLRKAARPQFVRYLVDENGRMKFIGLANEGDSREILVIKVRGELFFGAADLFHATLKSIAKDQETRILILHLKGTRDIDATGCLAIKQLHDYLKNSGRDLILAGIPFHTWEVLSHAGTIDLIGKDHLFLLDYSSPPKYMDKAILRARELLANIEDKESEQPQVEEEEIRAIPIEA